MRRLLIIDDHAGFVAAARGLLSAEGFDVVADAADGESGVELTERVRPDIVLLDIQLPGIDGFEVARRLGALERAPAVVLTSSRDAEDYGSRVETAQAEGFIAKSDLSGDRIKALLDHPS